MKILLHKISLSLFTLIFSFNYYAQVTVDVPCTGSANPNSGRVFGAGGTGGDDKYYGYLKHGDGKEYRGWARFNIQSYIPIGATITSAEVIFWVETSSGAADNNYLNFFTGNPGSMSADNLWDAIGGSSEHEFSNADLDPVGQKTRAINGNGITYLNNNMTVAVNLGFSRGTGNYGFRIHGSDGVGDNSTDIAKRPVLRIAYTLPCTVAPSLPTAISGSTTPCVNPGTSAVLTYSVTNDPNASSYTWTLPSGYTGTSTTNSISVSPGTNSGQITVIANNGCGSSSPQSVTINPSNGPNQPSSITGTTTLCSGIAGTYSVTNDPSATSYTWTLPTNWTGTSTTNSISTTSATNGGDITVVANNACGSSTSQSLTITIENAPAQPSVISGTTNICDGSASVYDVTNDPSATSYTWVLPTNWTGTSTTNSINTTSATNGGDVTVTANNACGSSPSQNLTVSIVSGVPAQASVISGNTSICSSVTGIYSITNDPSATSYTWTLPTNWTGTSATSSISATSAANGGDITVVANNACGSSPSQSLTISIENAPAQPSAISGSPSVCEVSTGLYEVTNDPSATSYTWTLPTNWTGTSTTNSISATSAINGGNITVTANNACGSSSPQTLTITSGTPPAQPSVIVGDIIICGLSTGTYSVTNDPSATSYTWTLPTNWTGTSSTNSISATNTANGGDITVIANNSCGSSASQTLNTEVNQPSSSTVTHTECGASYTFNSQNYTTDGIYTQVIPNNSGCDSTITLNLTLSSPFTAFVIQNGNTLSASLASATSYKWLDCDNGNTSIPNAINQDFVPANSGNYAVEITSGACSSTSACFTYTSTASINENSLSEALNLYPNPSKGIYTLTSNLTGEIKTKIYTLSGQQINVIQNILSDNIQLDLSNQPNGVYILEVSQNNLISRLKLIKE